MCKRLLLFYCCFLCGLLCVLSACSGPEANQPAGSPTPTPSSIPASSPTPVTPTSTTVPPVVSPTSTPGTSINQLQILLDRSQYGVQDTIQVRIINHLQTGIYVTARYTNCSIVQLQKQASAVTWNAVGRCVAIQSIRPIYIQSGAMRTVILRPTAQTTRPSSRSNTNWQAGIYRAVLFYHLTPDQDTIGGGDQVVSPSFTIV